LALERVAPSDWEQPAIRTARERRRERVMGQGGFNESYALAANLTNPYTTTGCAEQHA